MKISWNKKYTTIAAYSCLVIAFAAIVSFMFINSSWTLKWIRKILVILNPVIYGFVIAFVINPIMRFCENHFFSFVTKSKPRTKLKRVLSLIAAFLFQLIFILYIPSKHFLNN